jgi:soluble lytic murein transglycosylase-like protein
VHRVVLSSVMCLAFAGVSCRILPALKSNPLPAVSAAPAELATPIDLVQAPEPPQAAALPADPEVRKTLAHLKSRHTGLSRAELPVLAELIVSESRRLELDPALALAVIRVESGCFNYSVSQVGAMGLMQLMPATAEELAGELGLDWQGPDTLFDPSSNVKMGLAYLKQLSDRYGSTSTALAAYNWGPGRIDRRLRRGQSVPELYVTRVLKTVRPAGSGTS